MAQRVNAVVVGSGAAGGIVAKELAQAGLTVVVLEKGRQFSPNAAAHDELSGSGSIPGNITKLENLVKNPRSFRPDASTPARVMAASFNAFGVGGGTPWYGAAAWRFHEEHFRMRSSYGHPEGTNLEDWPITYADLEPYYEKAEYELGVSGLAGADSFAEPRKKPYPVPPLPINPQGEILRDAGKRIGWHPFPPPFAILTEAYHGRSACVQCPWCLAHACEVGAKSGTQITMLPRAIKTGKCELRANSFVTRITTDAKGRPNGVEYFDAQKQGHKQNADLIVVACSATESARLLLNSANKFHAHGLGNSSGQVGRNLNDHTGADAFGLFEREIPHERGPGPSIAFNDWNHSHAPGIPGGGYIYNYYCTLPIEFADNRPPGEATWGKAHKEFQRRYFYRFIHLGSNCQAMPQEKNSVDLDPKVRDAWGMPVARITHCYSTIDYQIANFVMDKEEQLLKEAGAIKTWRGGNAKGGVGDHQNGTCRMGNNPKDSVVNSYCQSHDADNLFVTDGSVFVTDAGFNPSLTIQAIAFRAADYIK